MKVYTKMKDVPFRIAAVYRLYDKYGDLTDYPCCWVDCEMSGVPNSYLVASTLAQVDEWITDEEIAYYAHSEESIYDIIKGICGYDIDIEYKGEEK